MTRAELRAAGEALFGPRWQTPLAVAIGVADRTMRRWIAGDGAIPEGAAADIERLLGRKRADQALNAIDKIIDEISGPPAGIRLTEGRDATGRKVTRLVAEALKARGLDVEIVEVGEGGAPDQRALKAARKP